MCAVDQHAEASGRMGGRIGISSMSINPMDQHYFATGGDDALGKNCIVL